MRIISKFIDYYDCGQSFGIDPSLLYFRSPERCKFRKNDERYPTALEACRAVPRCNPVYSFSPVLLGFCGKLYRVFLDQDVNSDFHCIQYRSSDLGDLIGEGEQELAHPKIVTSQVAIQRLRSALGAKAYPPDVMKPPRRSQADSGSKARALVSRCMSSRASGSSQLSQSAIHQWSSSFTLSKRPSSS